MNVSTNFGLIFIAFTIICIGYDYVVATKVVTEICQHSDIAATKSDGGRNKL